MSPSDWRKFFKIVTFVKHSTYKQLHSLFFSRDGAAVTISTMLMLILVSYTEVVMVNPTTVATVTSMNHMATITN